MTPTDAKQTAHPNYHWRKPLELRMECQLPLPLPPTQNAISIIPVREGHRVVDHTVEYLVRGIGRIVVGATREGSHEAADEDPEYGFYVVARLVPGSWLLALCGYLRLCGGILERVGVERRKASRDGRRR